MPAASKRIVDFIDGKSRTNLAKLQRKNQVADALGGVDFGTVGRQEMGSSYGSNSAAKR